MTELNLVHWSDFVRGVADPELERIMRERLEQASSSLKRDVELLRQVFAAGRRQKNGGVPESASRMAYALGSLRRAERRESQEAQGFFRQLPVHTLFDSALQPTSGVRGLEDSPRHVILEAEKFTVDVRIECQCQPRVDSGPLPENFEGVVAGQILRQEGDARPVPRTPVLVFSGDEIVGATLAGPSGEFQAEGLPGLPLSLALLVGREECIEIPLAPN